MNAIENASLAERPALRNFCFIAMGCWNKLGPMNSLELRDYFTDALRFWEPRRLIYNVVLAVIVIAYFAVGYPASKAVLSIDFALGLFLLAVAANIVYCAAYLADV